MSYSQFPLAYYDIYTIRTEDEKLHLEMCWCEENNTPYLRAPDPKKAIPSDLIDKENTFSVLSGTAIQFLAKNDDPKLVAITNAELVTLVCGTDLVEESTFNLLWGIYDNEPLRIKLKLPALGDHPACEKHSADCQALKDRLVAIHLNNGLEAALKAEAALVIALKSAREDVRKAEAALEAVGCKRRRTAGCRSDDF